MSAQPQHLAALAHANEHRLARAAVKAQLRSKSITLLDALAEPCCATATLYAMLAAQCRWGDRRTMKFLANLGNEWRTPISATRRVQDLTEREISVLRRALEGRT